MSSSSEICGYDPKGVSVADYLRRTYDPDPKKRKQVLSELCPCKTMEDFDVVWKRIAEMTHDESALVRDQALHNLGDGSPKHVQEVALEAAERLYNDPDLKVRKKARKMCVAYRHTGKWNVL